MKSKLHTLGFGTECPPDENFVRVYFLQKGATLDQAVRFYQHYKAKRWLNNNGKPLKDWKLLAWTWIWYGRATRN